MILPTSKCLFPHNFTTKIRLPSLMTTGIFSMHKKTVDILHIGPQLDGGGVLAYVHSIINSKKLNCEKLVHSILAPAVDASLKIKTASLVDCTEYQANARNLWRPLAEFLALLAILASVNEQRPRLIHAHTTLGGFYALACRCILGTRFVYTGHGIRCLHLHDRAFKASIVKLIERLIFMLADESIFLTHSEASFARKIFRIHSRSRVITTRIDCTFSHSPKGNLVVGCGALDSRKNPFLFIQIAKETLSVLNCLEFIWVGSGPLVEECNKLINTLGLEADVKFVGNMPNSEYLKLLSSSFLLLSTSSAEGLPLALIEAQLLLKPVITTAYLGYEEVVPDSTFGSVYLASEPMSAVNSICELLRNPLDYDFIASNAYERARQLFYDSSIFSSEYYSVYRQILNSFHK